MEEYKVVVLGSGAVGKSSLTIRLVTQNYLLDYDPTIEDSYNKSLTVDGVQVSLDILDTAGQDEYSQYQDQWMREGEAILLVYAVDDTASFRAAQDFKAKIDRVRENAPVSIVLVGNKCDLEETRQVTFDQGAALARGWGCGFLETSAKNKINNEECFFEAVRAIRRSRSKKKAKKPATSSSSSAMSWCSVL